MDAGATLIRAGRALVGEALDPTEDVAVVLEDGAISAVGKADEIEPPGDVAVVDATDLTLLPGFIDCHVHIGFFDPSDVLTRGVTTARDLAWPPEEIHRLAQRSRAPDFDGPMVLAAGPMLTAPGGYPTRAAWAPPGTGREVVGPDEAAAAVAQTASEGACVVKVALNPAAGPTLDGATLRSIVDAAHERGLRVTGHVYGLSELDKALDAQIDELAHMLMSHEPIPEDTIARMVAQEMVVVPTLSIRFGDDGRVAIDNLRRFVDAGGRVVYGTDLGNEGPSPGIDERELRGMLDAGLQPRRVITSATIDAARWLGLATKGALGPAMDADVIGVEGDPLSDPIALTNVRMVFRNGRRAL